MENNISNIEQLLIENIADFLDEENVIIEEAMGNFKDSIKREETQLHIRMAKLAMNEYKSTIQGKLSLIGLELYYKSQITKCFTKFKVKNVLLNHRFISNSLCFSVELISENGNKYIYEEDYIFFKIPNN